MRWPVSASEISVSSNAPGSLSRCAIAASDCCTWARHLAQREPPVPSGRGRSGKRSTLMTSPYRTGRSALCAKYTLPEFSTDACSGDAGASALREGRLSHHEVRFDLREIRAPQ